MNSSAETTARASSVRCTKEALIVELVDGRIVHVPIVWFPRLDAATPAQRSDVRLIGDGEGIHWPSVDEDLEVQSLLLSESEIRRGYRPIRPKRQRGQRRALR